MQEKKTKMFELQPKLTWRQLKGKKEDIIGEFTNEEMEQYVHKINHIRKHGSSTPFGMT